VDFGKLLGDKPLTRQVINDLEESQLVRDGAAVLKGAACCDGEDHALTVGVSAKQLGALQKTLEDSKTPATVVDIRYTKDVLKKLCSEIAGKEDFELTRSDWLAAQARDWRQIFQVPAILITICFFIFLLLGRNPKDEVAA
jgi:hypothetical protein